MSTPPAVPPPPGTAVEHETLPPGTRFGEFEIVRVLGIGGFGIVYLARDHSLERDVALKEYMPASLAMRGQGAQITVRSAAFAETYAIGLRSFVNEARLLARFDHASLVKVYRFWEDNATAYMVMPYLQGITLRDTRRAMTQPPEERWMRSVIDPIMSALEQLHRAGVYHRDIAPDNILLPGEGPPVLLDFGAARRVISDRTQSLTAILKPSYAPIEQYAEMSQLRQGPWTDIYALGAVVHFLLFGQPPAPATARALQEDPGTVAARGVRGVSARFLEAVDWALAIRPNQRPQTVDELRGAFEGRVAIPALGPQHITVPGALTPPAPARPPTGVGSEQPTMRVERPPIPQPTQVPPANPAPSASQQTVAWEPGGSQLPHPVPSPGGPTGLPPAPAPASATAYAPTAYVPPPGTAYAPTAYMPPPATQSSSATLRSQVAPTHAIAPSEAAAQETLPPHVTSPSQRTAPPYVAAPPGAASVPHPTSPVTSAAHMTSAPHGTSAAHVPTPPPVTAPPHVTAPPPRAAPPHVTAPPPTTASPPRTVPPDTLPGGAPTTGLRTAGSAPATVPPRAEPPPFDPRTAAAAAFGRHPHATHHPRPAPPPPAPAPTRRGRGPAVALVAILVIVVVALGVWLLMETRAKNGGAAPAASAAARGPATGAGPLPTAAKPPVPPTPTATTAAEPTAAASAPSVEAGPATPPTIAPTAAILPPATGSETTVGSRPATPPATATMSVTATPATTTTPPSTAATAAPLPSRATGAASSPATPVAAAASAAASRPRTTSRNRPDGALLPNPTITERPPEVPPPVVAETRPRPAAPPQTPAVETRPAGPASAKEACGGRVFIAFAVCMERECDQPRFRNTAECVPILERKRQREGR